VLQKKALGRGLDALFHSNPPEEAAAPAGVIQVPTDRIRPNPYQPRGEMDTERLQELVASIRVHGILQPLVVRSDEDGYELVAGERRFRAAQAAGLSEVPVVVRDCTNREMLELALIENLQREDINPIDAAIAFRRLVDEFGLTQEDIAAQVGRSRPAVANTLRLLNLPSSIQQRVASGELSEGHARALLGLESAPEAQEALAAKILAEHLSVRDTERLVRSITERHRPSETPDKTPKRDPHITRIEEHLQRYFGTRVSIARSGEKGSIRIDFYDQEQFERILELLTAS
jgi:ParB family chromosome partitioning protein